MKLWRRKSKTRAARVRTGRRSLRRDAAKSTADGAEAAAWYEAGRSSSGGSRSGSGGFWEDLGDWLKFD